MMSSEDHGVVWINGTLTPIGDAVIHPFDHAVTVGDGVFETFAVHGGVAFAVDRHLARLRRSAAAMGINPGVSNDHLKTAMAETIRADQDAGIVRLTVSAGVAPLGSARGDSGATIIIATGPGKSWDTTTRVVTVEWPRNERGALSGIKSTSYGENVVALRQAHAAGATEAIFANTVGNLCEGTGSNVFLEVDGKLVTPPLSSGCLAGITRELVMEIVQVEERDVPLEALFDASEIFITSTTRDVLAVARIDDHVVPEAPGPLTKQAAVAFANLKQDTKLQRGV